MTKCVYVCVCPSLVNVLVQRFVNVLGGVVAGDIRIASSFRQIMASSVWIYSN